MDAQISRADLTDAVGSLRALLAAIDAGELSCSTGYLTRLRGAVVALEALAQGQADTVASLEAPASESSTR